MRRLPALFIASAVLIAGCAGNPPKQTPIAPWTPPTPPPTPFHTPAPTPNADASARQVRTGTGAIAGWVDFAPAGESFAILMPVAPGDPQTATQANQAGNLTITTWASTGKDCQVSITTVKGFSGTFAADQILDGAPDQIASTNNPPLKASKPTPVTIAGKPGRTFTLTGKTADGHDVYVLAEIVLDNGTLYNLAWGAPAAPADTGEPDAFFASFLLS